MNITRRRPDDSFSGMVKAAFGNYSEVTADIYVSVPVMDQLSVMLGAATDRRDGYFYNTTLDRTQGELHFNNYDVAIAWRPIDNLEFYYRFDPARLSRTPIRC